MLTPEAGKPQPEPVSQGTVRAAPAQHPLLQPSFSAHLLPSVAADLGRLWPA